MKASIRGFTFRLSAQETVAAGDSRENWLSDPAEHLWLRVDDGGIAAGSRVYQGHFANVGAGGTGGHLAALMRIETW